MSALIAYWGTIETSAEGFILRSYSRYQGTRTGVAIAIPITSVPWAAGEDLAKHAVICVGVLQDHRRQLTGSPEPVLGERLLQAGDDRAIQAVQEPLPALTLDEEGDEVASCSVVQ